MRPVLFAALGFVLTVPFQPAVARDNSHHARSHARTHHAHHHRHIAYRHARHHRRLAYRQDWGAMRLSQDHGFGWPGAVEQTYGYERSVAPRVARREVSHNGLDSLISRHAQMNGIPESLLHRVVMRESRYNPRAVGRGGAMGLMQIKTATARAMGYSGSAAGLLDAETNITYAARYLAGAYRAAGGSHDRAVSNYARGYYYQAKAQGFSPYASPYAQDRTFGGFATTAQYRRSGVFEQPVRERPL